MEDFNMDDTVYTDEEEDDEKPILKSPRTLARQGSVDLGLPAHEQEKQRLVNSQGKFMQRFD